MLSCGLKVRVIGSIAECTPVPFVSTAICIENDHAVVNVTVGDVEFRGGVVFNHMGRTTKVLCVIAPAILPFLSDLH